VRESVSNRSLSGKSEMTLTRLLVAVNVLVFIAETATGNISDTRVLIRDGALYGPAVAHGDLWRVFASEFLHASWLHIVSNMIALWQVGTLIEMMYDRTRMAIIYGVAIIGSGMAVYFFAYSVATVGASGAIFGLFGALVAAGLRLGRIGRELVQQSSIIIAANLAIGLFLAKDFSNAAHIGGLIAGALLGLLLYRMPVYTGLVSESIAA
jgi:rhomboid protease GluP